MAKADKEQKKNKDAAMALLRDPQFLYRLCERIGAAGVTGETRNRLIVYLACLRCAFGKVVSILIKGATSTGKNNLAKAVLAIIPPERIVPRSSFSNTALVYGSEELAGKILYLVEHRAGRDAQLFTRILQSEEFLQHEATSGGKTRLTGRVGAPMFLTTTTDEAVYADDETRYLSLRADDSPELTREILRNQFNAKRKGGE
jgi:hypothetical protein